MTLQGPTFKSRPQRHDDTTKLHRGSPCLRCVVVPLWFNFSRVKVAARYLSEKAP